MDAEKLQTFETSVDIDVASSAVQKDHSSLVDESRTFGIQEVVEQTGISAFTIRYYDKLGFFPNIIRGKRGVRSFSQDDINQLRLVDALRKSGLSIEGISYFVRLGKKGQESLDERKLIIQNQATALEYQIEEMQESLRFLKTVQHMLGK